MKIDFNDTKPANASAQMLFDVLTDYTAYPSFNSRITGMTVVRKDQGGAEFAADRKTLINKQARAFDRHQRNGDFVGTPAGVDGSSTWTVHAVDAGHSTLTIDGTMNVGLLPWLVMKLALKRILYEMDFNPFIQETERRAKAAKV
jgi:hypothetical protein